MKVKLNIIGDEEYCDMLKEALNEYRKGNASRMLHEIAQCIYGSDNPERMARMFFCAGDMYALLKKIAGKEDMCVMSDIEELLRLIDGKEDE